MTDPTNFVNRNEGSDPEESAEPEPEPERDEDDEQFEADDDEKGFPIIGSA